MEASRPRFRSGLAVLASALFLAGALIVPGLADPPLVTATEDPQCATEPDFCATVTISLTGFAPGHAYVGATAGGNDGNFNCHRAGSVTAGNCRHSYYVRNAPRVIHFTGERDEDPVMLCLIDACSQTHASQLTISSGNRYTRTLDIRWIEPRTVTIRKEGTGQGTVVASRPGINCGSICEYPYANGMGIRFTVTPAEGTEIGKMNVEGETSSCNGGHLTYCDIAISQNITLIVRLEIPATQPPETAPPATSTPAPTKTPTPTRTPTTTRTPSAAPTAVSQTAAPTLAPSVPATAGPLTAPPPTTTLAPTADASVNPSLPVSLPPIATRGPSADENAASGTGDMMPLLLVVLVTVVAMGGFVLLRARR